MTSVLENFCIFCRSFGDIEWRKTSIIICAMPFMLLFVMMHMLVFLCDRHVGSVVSNAAECANVGKKIMSDGGSVVDVAIAVLVCESIFLPHRVGIGGGFTAIMYIDGMVDTITATPTVPANFPSGIYKIPESDDEYKLVGVPGELKGYWEMHQKYGMLPWARLFQPTIDICEKGFPKLEWEENQLHKFSIDIYRSPMLRKLYYTLSKESNEDVLKFLALSRTLRKVASDGVDAFYRGEIGKELIADLQKVGGILTEKDLRDYNVSWSSKPVTFLLPNDLRGYTTPLPSSGALVAFVVNVVKSLRDKDSPVFWHKVIEAMKHAYGRSYSLADIDHETDARLRRVIKRTYENLVDVDFAIRLRDVIRDSSILQNVSRYGVKYRSTYQGTSSNICVISPRGNAIVLSSSLLTKSSSVFYSVSTGIVLNNQIQSFEPKSYETYPDSPNSYTRYGKRTLTSHCPTIIMSKKSARVFFAVGASGDEGAVSQVITALLQQCLLYQNAFTAVNSRFFFPEVLSGIVLLSTQVVDRSDIILNYLFKVGHFLLPFLKSNPYALRSCISHSRLSPNPQRTHSVDGGIALIKPEHDFSLFLVITIVGLSLATVVVMAYEIIKFSRINIHLAFSSATET